MLKLQSTVQRYVTDLAAFKGAQWGNVRISSGEITMRELILAIPEGASAAQMQLLTELQQWAAKLGVNVNVTTVP